MQDEILDIVKRKKLDPFVCKPILLPSKRIAKIISGFSNSKGGYIIFGAEFDSDKVNVLGLSSDFYIDATLQKAIELLNPKPMVKVDFISIEEKKLVAIKVEKSGETIFSENNKYIYEDDELLRCKGEIKLDNTKVFIVHGHDNLAKQETARFVESLGLKAIILHEQASAGNTIIEKIEAYSNVGFAIVLYTPCDLGKAKGDNDLSARARQNVVFEHGYLMGKIGRNNVCALVKSQVEKPNDISGVVYVEMDEAGGWKHSLLKEMKSSGYDIDANVLFN